MGLALCVAAPLAAPAQPAAAPQAAPRESAPQNAVPSASPVSPTAPAEPHADDRPPTPMADFAVRGTVRPEGEAAFSYRDGRMRVEIFDGPNTVMVGLIDPKTRKLVVLPNLTGMEGLAIEMDLPPEFGFAAMPAGSHRVGLDSVGTEPCEVWRGIDAETSTPVESCITLDGIPLRVRATARGGVDVSFEATMLERAPQDPAAFELPAGTKVRRIPRSLQNMVPGGFAP